jgi:hypothetical protein
MSIMIGIGISPSLNTGSGYSFVNAEAAALVARFTTPPTNIRKALIDDLVGSLKTAGVWSKPDALYIKAAHDAQAARQNWIADQYNLTPVASPTFTVDRGYQSDGVSSYLTTGFNPSTASSPKFTQNSAGFGFWSRTDVQSASTVEIGNSNNVILPRNASDQALYRVNNSTAASTGNGVTTSAGFFAALRADAANERIRQNTTQKNTTVLASAAVSNSPFTVCGRNTNTAGGYTVSPGNRQLAMSFIGANLTDGECDALYAAVNTYLTAIGAA